MDILEKLKQPITSISSELFKPKTEISPQLFQPTQPTPKKMESPIQTAKSAGGLVLDMIRAPIRAVVSATGVIDTKGTSEIVPTTKAEKLIFGEEPIPSFQRKVKDTQKVLETTNLSYDPRTRRWYKEEGGLSPTLAKIMAFPAVAGLTVLDVYLGGEGASKKVVMDLIKEGTEVGVKNILTKSTKFAPEVIDNIAPKLASATTEKEVKSILDTAVKVPQTPKTAPQQAITPTVENIPKDLEPLAQEARKYKSAEEFVNNQIKLFRGDSGGQLGKGTDLKKLASRPQGISMTTDEKVGRKFMQGKNIGTPEIFKDTATLQKFGIKPNTKILDSRKLGKEFEKIDSDGTRFIDENDLTTIEYARENGYDVLDFSNDARKLGGHEKEMVVLNSDALYSKSQLTDIWNKVNGQATRLQEQVGVQGAESKPPSEAQGTKLKIGEEVPHTEGKPPTQKSVPADVVADQTLATQYPEEARKAIGQVSAQTGDSPKLTSRVFDSLKNTKTKVIEYVQNEQERVRKLVSRPDVKITDASDPYLKATLYSGRVNAQIENVKNEAEKIIKDIKSSGISREEVSDYLYFRHAPERNAAIGEKASGITTEEARTGLKALESSPKGKEIKRIADKVQEINNRTLTTLKESGVITDKLYKTLTTKYKNHVPLQRIFEETEDIGTALSGKGFDVRSTGIKGAKGSERKVSDIMTNVLTNYEQAILRSEKNIVDNATLKFVRDNKVALGDSMVIKKPKAVGQTFEGTPILERTQDPQILQMFEDGKRVWIEIKDPELAIALKGIGKEKLPGILRVVGAFTRFYSGLATRFNPEFALPNKIRDLQETMVYLASQKDVGFKGAAKTALGDPASTKSVLDYLRGADTPGARLYAEMREAGGTTGGFGLSTRKQVELNLEKLEKLANSKTKRIADNLVEYVDNFNTIFEDSTRLSVYKQAINSGLSVERAAFLAKEASINFNRMGRGGPLINSLYMFSNASIQGSMKMLRAMKNPKVAMAVSTAVGGSVAAVSEWNDKVDPDWRNKVSKWDRLNNLTIVVPSTDGEFRVAKIPVSWGIKPIKVMADYVYDTLSGKDLDVKKAMSDVLIATIEAYNPAGGSDLLSALSPTVLDVPFELGRNKSWSGNKIKPDYDSNAPEDVRYFQSLGETKTGQVAISISEMLYDKLNIAISPADMKYAYEQYVGGAGRAITKTANLLGSFASEEPLPLDEYPMLSRFYSERTAEEVGSGAGGRVDEIKSILEGQSRERFKLNKEAEELDKKFSEMPRAEANRELLKIKREDKALYEKVLDEKESRELGLTYEERLIKQLGVSNGERAEYLHNQIMSLPTSQERNKYYLDLKRKKVISDEVAEQLRKLKLKQK